MPTFNITLEDTSPMIRYSTNWRAGHSADDSSADKYSEKSFTVCQAQGDSLQFQYYGAAVTVFGSHRGNHGTYTGQLDGGPVFTGNGSGSDAFMQPLYSANATLGMHKVMFTNQQNNFLDVDYITFQTSVGQDGEDLIVNTFQDDHPAFIYTPISSWSNSTDRLSWFSGSTGHVTTDPSASVKFTFEGDAIALYGPVGPSGGQFVVQLDNSTSQYSSKQEFFKPKEILYYAGNLGGGNHTLQIQVGSSNLQQLAIDYADVYTTASLGGSFLASTSPNILVDHQSKSPTGLIAGLAVTSALALLSTLACIYLVWRLRRENKDSNSILPILPPTMSSTAPHASASFVAPSNVPGSATTTTGNSYYPSHTVPSSSGGAPSTVSSGRAAAPTVSGYMPQGKRNAANMSHSAVAERRDSQFGPPQYTEGS